MNPTEAGQNLVVLIASPVSYLFRTTGQVIGVALSGALLQSVLLRSLRARITGPGADELIRSIRSVPVK